MTVRYFRHIFAMRRHVAHTLQSTLTYARARAGELLPRAACHWPLAAHAGRAEAALIALWGARELGRIAGEST